MAQEPKLKEDGDVHFVPAVDETANPKILAKAGAPFSHDGGLRMLDGNLGRAVIKVSAVKSEHHTIEAPVRVFDTQHGIKEAFDAGELDHDVIAVCRFQGPKANGMPELHKLTPPLGVFILDDHKFVGELLAHRLAGNQQIKVLGIANSASAGVHFVTHHKVDVVLVDMELGEEDGVDVARQMLDAVPSLRIIGLSAHAESHYPIALLEAGGRGFISKRASATEVIEGVRRVARGDLAISPDVAFYLATEMREAGPVQRLRALTAKEIEVLRLLSCGYSVDEISDSLEVSSKTVQSHRANMKRKLELSTDVELCLLALKAGVVRMHETR